VSSSLPAPPAPESLAFCSYFGNFPEVKISAEFDNFFWLWFADKTKNYPVKVNGVKIVPDPVKRGVPTTFKISASSGIPFSGHNFSMLLFPCVRSCLVGYFVLP
jgi:hypothetical protein